VGGWRVDHTADLVMFDVPPPEEGVRGIDAYSATWLPRQARGASFEILELEVTAGSDVAFTWALLRCGTPQDPPGNRPRLALGLREEKGR
jgi:ketosteroid isomerase-like protein